MTVHFLYLIVVLGLIFYLVDRFIPMAEPFKTVFRVVCVIVAIVLLMQFLSGYTGMHL